MKLSPEFLARFEAELMKIAPWAAAPLAGVAQEHRSNVRSIIEATIAAFIANGYSAAPARESGRESPTIENSPGPRQYEMTINGRPVRVIREELIESGALRLVTIHPDDLRQARGESLDSTPGNHVVTYRWPGKEPPK